MEFVDIKMRKEFRDLLKQYCAGSGDKMYVLMEKLIEQHCKAPDPSRVLKSKRK